MNTLANFLPWIQIILSFILVAFILLQQSSASAGSAFGGGDSDGTHHTRRGPEKTIFNATIIIAILFALSAFVALFV